MHLWRRLGIVQAILASALALHKRLFSTDVLQDLAWIICPPYTHFYPRKTFQSFICFAICLFISRLPLNGWACKPFSDEGFYLH